MRLVDRQSVVASEPATTRGKLGSGVSAQGASEPVKLTLTLVLLNVRKPGVKM